MLKFAVPLAQPFQFAHDAGPRAPRRYPPTGRRAPSAPAPGPRPARTTSTADLVMAAPGRLPVATRPDPARQAPAAAPIRPYSAAMIAHIRRSSGRVLSHSAADARRRRTGPLAVRFAGPGRGRGRGDAGDGAAAVGAVKRGAGRRGRLAIIRATVSGARVRSCQSRRQTGAPGTAVGPDDVDGRPGEPGNGGAGAPTSRNACPTLRAKRPPRHPPRLVHFAGFRMQSHDSLLRIRPPCHHPRHCIGCACQILSVTPSNRGAGDRGRPGRRRRPTGRARQRRSRGAYQPQRGPTLRAKRPPWRARRSTPAACHARSTTPPPPSDSHWRRGIRRAHIPMPTLHTLAHAPPAAQGRPRRRFRRRPNRNRRIVAIAAAFPVRVDTLPPSPPRFLVTCRP